MYPPPRSDHHRRCSGQLSHDLRLVYCSNFADTTFMSRVPVLVSQLALLLPLACSSAPSTSPDARKPACGDSVLDAGEACDDGNQLSSDGCSADCRSDETCGNNFIDTNEVCDDGNIRPGDGCSAACASDESCGNSILDMGAGETCDDGNTLPDATCSPFCQINVSCGDGVVNAGEACDPGPYLDGVARPLASCDVDCTMPVCGDLVVNMVAGEQCDDMTETCLGCVITTDG